VGGSHAGQGSGKSGSVSDLQSALRAHLARVEKVSARVCCPKTGESRTAKPIFDSHVKLGQKVRREGNQKHFARRATKSAGIGIGKKDADGNVVQEAPLPIWANFRQRALDVAITEINGKTDLHIELMELEALERSKHRRVNALSFAIKTQELPKRRTNL
jgi:hypothetical protein